LLIFGTDENKDLKSVYESPVFWTELIHQRFLEYYSLSAVGFAYKKIYFDLTIFEKLLQRCKEDTLDNKYEILYTELNDYPELRDYLILNKLIIICPISIDTILNKSDLRVFKVVFEQLSITKEALLEDLSGYFWFKTSDILTFLINYECISEDKEIIKIFKPDRSKSIRVTSKPGITKNNFKQVINKCQFMGEDKDDNRDNVKENIILFYNKYLELNQKEDGLYYRLKFLLQFGLNTLSNDTINHVLKDYIDDFNINTEDLIKLFKKAILTNNNPLILLVYKHIKTKLNESTLKVISDYIKSEIYNNNISYEVRYMLNDTSIHDLEKFLEKLIYYHRYW